MSVTDIATRMQPAIERQAERILKAREDVKNALPGAEPMRVALAQARAERNIVNGVPIGTAIDRAVSWARWATDMRSPAAPSDVPHVS